MFKKLAQNYYDKNLIVVPITPGQKAPLVKDWNNVDFSNHIDKYANWGIGIKPKASGLMVLDIDVEHEEAKAEIKALLPPIYCGRTGSAKRLPSVFFKYDERFEGKSYGPIEVLTGNKQCVIPPTIHPSGVAYQWVGHTDLLGADMDMMPSLEPDLYNEICKVVVKYGLNKNKDKTIGRNNKLSEAIYAKVCEGKDPTTAVKEIIAFDKENHNPPWFSDKSENHKLPPETIALQMYQNALKKHGKAWGIDNETISIGRVKLKQRERVSFPKFRGIAQEFFDCIYENAHIPRSRMTTASVISTMSVLLSNKLRYKGVYTNMYSLMILDSGGGKDFPLKFPQLILSSFKEGRGLIGIASPSSDTGIIKDLTNQPVRIDIVDEASQVFGVSRNKNAQMYATKMIETYTLLYSCTGRYYAGKSLGNSDKKIGECQSPCVSFFGAMTPSAFKDTFDKSLIETGLGGRILYFYDDEFKESSVRKSTFTARDIPLKLREFAKDWVNQKPTGFIDLSMEDGSVELADTPCVLDAIEKANKYLNVMKKRNIGTLMLPIYNRAIEHLYKLIMIDTVSTQYEHGKKPREYKVKVDNVEWAMRWLLAYFKITEDFIHENIQDAANDPLNAKIVDFVKESKNKGVLPSDITRKFQKENTKRVNHCVKDKIDAKIFFALENKRIISYEFADES